jgi:hypothetical protein
LAAGLAFGFTFTSSPDAVATIRISTAGLALTAAGLMEEKDGREKTGTLNDGSGYGSGDSC